jgi:anti-anti-sigma factor
MKTTVTEHDGYAMAQLEGVVDESAMVAFDEQLHPIIEVPDGRLLLDLSGSERLTSAGIGHLVTLVSRANAKGSHVVLCQPSSYVRSILNATKLNRFFDIEPTVDEGSARLRAER